MKPWCLLARLGGIGDNLIASSVLPLLAETHNVEVMAQKPQHVLFENNPYVSKLTVREPGDLPADGNQWQAWFRHRGREYDRWFNLSHSCEGTLALLPGQTQFHWPVAWRRKHCGVNYLEAVHDIVGVRHEFNPRFYPTEDEARHAGQTLAKVRGSGGYRCVVGVAISGSRLDKIWPYLPLLVAKLVRELHVAVVLFGAENEVPMAVQVQDFVREFNGGVQGLFTTISADPKIPPWPIRRSIATLQQCDLVISPDTGLAWGVAMEDVPKIILLSHASPENITRHWINTTTLHAAPAVVDCWPCHQLHDEIGTCRKAENANAAACISDINHEAVLIAAKAALEGQNGRYRGLLGKGHVGLEPERAGGDAPRFVGGGPVARDSVVGVGIGDRDRLGDDAPEPADGGGGVTGW